MKLNRVPRCLRLKIGQGFLIWNPGQVLTGQRRLNCLFISNQSKAGVPGRRMVTKALSLHTKCINNKYGLTAGTEGLSSKLFDLLASSSFDGFRRVTIRWKAWDLSAVMAPFLFFYVARETKGSAVFKVALSRYSVFLRRFFVQKMAARRLEAAAPANEKHGLCRTFFSSPVPSFAIDRRWSISQWPWQNHSSLGWSWSLRYDQESENKMTGLPWTMVKN